MREFIWPIYGMVYQVVLMLAVLGQIGLAMHFEKAGQRYLAIQTIILFLMWFFLLTFISRSV